MALARAHTAWGDAGGWDAEVLWDTCCTIALRQPLTDGRRAAARHALGRRAEAARPRGAAALRRRRAPARRARQLPRRPRQAVARGRAAATARRRSCSSATTASCWPPCAQRVVTLEGGTAWVHGGLLRHLARGPGGAPRPASTRSTAAGTRSASGCRRSLVEYRRRASMGSDTFASRVRATKSKIERFEAAPPPERVVDHQVTMRLGGDRTGTRVDHLRAARAARPHRPVRRRGRLRRAHRRARPERHRQEPLPPAARRRGRRPRRHVAARRPRRARLLLADPRPPRAARASTCSTSC